MKKLIVLCACVVFPTLSSAQWKGHGEVGLVKSSGNTESESFNVALGLVNDSAPWLNEFALKYIKASSDNVNSAKSASLDYIGKRLISDKSYLFAGVAYLDDDFDSFTEQSSAYFGYGYYFIKSEKTNLDVGVGVGYRDATQLVKLAGGVEVEGDDVSGGMLIGLIDFNTYLTANTQFLNKFRAEVSSDNSFIVNDMGVSVAMNEAFSLKAGVLIRHNTNPAEGSDKTDTITSINLVYNFK